MFLYRLPAIKLVTKVKSRVGIDLPRPTPTVIQPQTDLPSPSYRDQVPGSPGIWRGR